MGKIIAIGGGEIGRPGFPVETTKIDREIIRLSGKKHPKLLFLPTASSDAEGYIETVKKHFGKRLGCKVQALRLVKGPPPYGKIKKLILASDIIYVGGGNTYNMLKIWRRLKLDKILRLAYDKNIVLSGLSAGAICWFRYGLSDMGKVWGGCKNIEYKKIKGLGFIDVTLSPHHIREPKRKQALIKVMQKTRGAGLALDDYAAIEVIDDEYRIITSKPRAQVHKVFWQSDKCYFDPVKMASSFQSLEPLISI